MSYRFGQFLVVSGLIILIIFAVTLQAGDKNIFLCVGAAFCLVVGIYLAIRFRPPSEPVARFRTVNKFRKPSPKDKP
jgi:type II secretory pathway component PulM